MNDEMKDDSIQNGKLMEPKLILIIVLVSFSVLFSIYYYYNSLTLPEEELGLSVQYLQNVTRVEDAKISLNFNEKKMTFVSKLFVEGNGITLKSNSKGFQNNDSNCNQSIEIFSDTVDGLTRAWRDSQPISFKEEYGKINYIELKKTCQFQRDLVPNGVFFVHLYGKDKSEQAPIKNIQLITSFNSDKFDCRDACIFTKDFLMVDSDNENQIRTIVLEGNTPDVSQMKFELRTIDLYSKSFANYLFITIQIAIGIAVSIIVYAFSLKQQRLTDQIIGQINKITINTNKITIDTNKIIGQINKITTDTNKISEDTQRVISNQEKLRDQRKKFAKGSLNIYLDSLKWDLESTQERFTNYASVGNTSKDKKSLNDIWEEFKQDSKYFLEILDSIVSTTSDVLEPSTDTDILMIIQDLKNPPENPMNIAHEARCKKIIERIEFLQENFLR